MGHITALLPALAGQRHPAEQGHGAPAAQHDISVSLIPSVRFEGNP